MLNFELFSFCCRYPFYVSVKLSNLKNFNIEIYDNKTLLYQKINKKTQSVKTYWGESIPLSYKNINLQLLIWPTDAYIYHMRSWIPIISLLTGLLFTFLLAFVVRTLQLVNENQDELKKSALQFMSVLNTTSDAIIIINKNGQIVLVNQAAIELCGYSESEFDHMHIEMLIPDRYEKVHVAHPQGYTQSRDIFIKTKQNSGLKSGNRKYKKNRYRFSKSKFRN